MFLSWLQKSELHPALAGVKSPGSGFTVKSLLLSGYSKAEIVGWLMAVGRQVWIFHKKWIFHPTAPWQRHLAQCGLEVRLCHSVNESLDDKQPVKDALGHSRHLKKPSRYSTGICPINCVSVPNMRVYATIKSLTKPSLPFQHLNGVRTLRVWKPRFCSCPCLREIPSNSFLLWTVP